MLPGRVGGGGDPNGLVASTAYLGNSGKRLFFIPPFELEAPYEGKDDGEETKKGAEGGIPGQGLDAKFDTKPVVGGDEGGDEERGDDQGRAGDAAEIVGEITDERSHYPTKLSFILPRRSVSSIFCASRSMLRNDLPVEMP